MYLTVLNEAALFKTCILRAVYYFEPWKVKPDFDFEIAFKTIIIVIRKVLFKKRKQVVKPFNL